MLLLLNLLTIKIIRIIVLVKVIVLENIIVILLELLEHVQPMLKRITFSINIVLKVCDWAYRSFLQAFDLNLAQLFLQHRIHW